MDSRLRIRDKDFGAGFGNDGHKKAFYEKLIPEREKKCISGL
jgi:hypothetical protein